MQTYVTYHSHVKTARALDDIRLDKQRTQVLQILETLAGNSDDHRNHPAVRMWDGHETALIFYGFIIVNEWQVERGHVDTTWGRLAQLAIDYGLIAPESRVNGDGKVTSVYANGEPPDHPLWLQDIDVLRSHRSNLVRMAPHIYADLFPETPANMPYLWPQNVRDGYRLRLTDKDQKALEDGSRQLPEWLRWDPSKLEVVHV